METALAHLKAFVGQHADLKEAEWLGFASIFQLVTARRKEILTTEGEVEKSLYFVLEGVQRAYFVHPDGTESTLVFTYPYSFSGVADSFLLQQPSRFYFETLTPSTFLRTSYQQLDLVLQKHPSLERMLRVLVSQTLAGVLYRQVELQSFSAEEKFRALLKRSPHVLTMIPHKYLASYIGVDPTNFSKLLNTIKI